MQAAEAYQPNTTVCLLKGRDWQRLLLLIGDALMLHVLIHASVFLPLANGCYLQVTGPPLAQVAHRSWPALSLPCTAWTGSTYLPYWHALRLCRQLGWGHVAVAAPSLLAGELAAGACKHS